MWFVASIAWALLLWGLPARASADEQPVSIGVLPLQEPLRLIRQFEPIAAQLAGQFGKPVLVRSRETLADFIEALDQGDFEVVVTVPHLAPRAQLRGDYQPIAQFVGTLRLVAVLPADSDLAGLAARPSLVVAVPDPLAMSAIAGERWLTASLPGTAYRLEAFQTYGNVARAVMRGEADIGFVSTLIENGLTPEARAALQIVDLDVPIPQLVLLCRRSASTELCSQTAQVLQTFACGQQGLEFFRNAGLGGLQLISDLPDLGPIPRHWERLRVEAP